MALAFAPQKRAHGVPAALPTLVTSISYVIDFYNAAPNPDMPVAMHLDVRPALDSVGCVPLPASPSQAACLKSSACTGTAPRPSL